MMNDDQSTKVVDELDELNDDTELVATDEGLSSEELEKEEVTEELDKEVAESDQMASTLISLQNLIERNANELDIKRQQLKELREQIKNIFENDAQLSEASEQAQQITQLVKERKQSIDNQPEVRQLKLKMTDVKEEMTEIEETLNASCINLFQLTGSNSFDTSDGDQREFELRAKVKSKKKSD